MIRETFYEDTLENLKKLLSNYTVERDANIFRVYRHIYASKDKFYVKIKIATIVITWDDKLACFELVPTEATSVRDFQNLYRAFKGEENLPLLS